MPSGLDLDSLVKNHQAGVWRYLRTLGCDASQAEELTQETFLAVFEKPFQDYHPAATAAYLRKVARNLFISFQRRASRTVLTVDLDEVDQNWSRWGNADGGEAMLAALQSCLATLSERSRQALNLRFHQRLGRAEIAAGLNMSEDGAKNLLQRAKQKLRECIERKLQ